MKLYFTRHGKTEWNQKRLLQGRNGDSPLLPESYQQIEQLGDYLTEIKFHKIYASPSLRARTTAEKINQRLAQPAEIIFKEGLREFGLGELEGVSLDLAFTNYPEQMEAMWNDLSQYDPSAFGGETVTSLLSRMSEVIVEAVVENETEQPILFVSHGAALSSTIRHLAGFALDQLRSAGNLANNTISILEVDPDHKFPPYQLIEWNNGSFLSS